MAFTQSKWFSSSSTLCCSVMMVFSVSQRGGTDKSSCVTVLPEENIRSGQSGAFRSSTMRPIGVDLDTHFFNSFANCLALYVDGVEWSLSSSSKKYVRPIG